MVRKRSFHLQVWLSEEERQIYEWLLRCVAGVSYSRSMTDSFRKLLYALKAYVEGEDAARKRRQMLKHLEEWPDFEPPAATRGPLEIEVEGPEELEAVEEGEGC